MLLEWVKRWWRRTPPGTSVDDVHQPVTERLAPTSAEAHVGEMMREVVHLNARLRETGTEAAVEAVGSSGDDIHPAPTEPHAAGLDTPTGPLTSDVVRLGAMFTALRKTGTPLPVQAVASLGLALIEGLRATPDAHLRGQTPNEVLVTSTGRVRVLAPHHRITFMSPEVVLGEPADEVSDVYSVCALLFAAATGRPAVQHHGESVSEYDRIRAVIEGQRAALDTLRSGLPSGFVQAIHRGLEPQRANRFPTLASLQVALAQFAGEAGAGRQVLVTMAFDAAPTSSPPRPLQDADDAQVLAAIAKGDDSAREVYADLLEERGLVDHAQWLRLEAEVQRAPAAERPALLATLTQLRPRVGREFLASVGRPVLEGCPVVFGFRCPMTWEALRPTRDPTVRYCEGCASTVTYFDSLEEAQRASWAGACVAIDPTVERSDLDLERGGMVLGRIA
jgi:uncharacterized protein (TIGR02996 family)